MIRNLVGLLLLLILVIWGMSWYHMDSTKTIKGQPLFLTHWEDTTAKANLVQAIHSGNFKPIRRQRYNFGYTESIHWFKFSIKTQGIAQELSLEIKNHLINHLELFEVHEGKITSLGKSGDAFVFSQRPTPSRAFVYPISLEAYDAADYYLRLDKRFENLATEITLWQTGDFEDKDQREYLLWGIFSGVVLFIIILNLIFWKTTQDTVYLWYSAYVAGLTLRQLADSGLGFQYVWPNLPALNYPDAIIQALWLYVPAQLQFQQQFLELRKSHSLQYNISQVLKYSFLICLIILIFLQISGIVYRFSFAPILISRIHAVISTSTMFFFVWTAVIQMRSDDSLKRMYGVGLGLQISGQMLIIVQNLLRNRVNGLYFIDSYLILFFIFFIDVVLFAYLLAYRYRKSRADYQQLQLNLVLTQQSTNQKIIEVLESERQQVNDQLLNDVGRRLNASKDALAEASPSLILTDALRLISTANEDLSRIVENRVPVEFIEKGLIQSLKGLTQQLNQSQKTVFQFRQIGEMLPLPINDEIQLYRICTELINNLIKHAQATRAEIRLEQHPNLLIVCVEDNGKGIDTTKIKAGGGGIGFKNIYARAQELGAEVQIDSAPGGTCISLKIQTS